MNTKSILVLIGFSLFVSVSSFSQNFSVSSKLIDLQKQPIAYANILLLSSQDSTAVKGTTTLDDGSFIIENVSTENYTLKISFVGFKDVLLPIQVINTDLVIQNITLEEAAEALNEVSILAKKPTLKKEVDRLVFSVANTALSEGNMKDVLKSTPSV